MDDRKVRIVASPKALLMQGVFVGSTCSIVTAVCSIALPQPFKLIGALVGLLAMFVASRVFGNALEAAGLIELEADPGRRYRKIDQPPAELPKDEPPVDVAGGTLPGCCAGCGYPLRFEGGRACACHKCAPELFERCPGCARDVHRVRAPSPVNTLCSACGYPRALECLCHRCSPELYETCKACGRDKLAPMPGPPAIPGGEFS